MALCSLLLGLCFTFVIDYWVFVLPLFFAPSISICIFTTLNLIIYLSLSKFAWVEMIALCLDLCLLMFDLVWVDQTRIVGRLYIFVLSRYLEDCVYFCLIVYIWFIKIFGRLCFDVILVYVMFWLEFIWIFGRLCSDLIWVYVLFWLNVDISLRCDMILYRYDRY